MSCVALEGPLLLCTCFYAAWHNAVVELVPRQELLPGTKHCSFPILHWLLVWAVTNPLTSGMGVRVLGCLGSVWLVWVTPDSVTH
jgi:hypothetical protein